MKFFYLTIVCALAGYSVKAQTLTQANHAPAVGDAHKTYQCDSTGVGAGTSGAGSAWTYTSVVTHSAIAKTYTNNAYGSATYAPADVVKFSGQTDIAYYKSSTNDLKYYGGSIAIQTVVATIIYSSPAIRASYPMSLNTSSTSPISGTLNISQPIAITASFNGNSSVVADGTGSLTLPGGAGVTFTNVIRVVSSQTINFSVPPPFSTTGTITQVNYDYYAVGLSKVPLFSIATSTAVNALIGTVTGSVVTINQDYPSLVTSTVNVGISENKSIDTQVNVYPNPASAVVNLTTESPAVKEAIIYDITGKQVDRQSFTDGKLKLDVSDYNNGLYLYKVLNAAGDNLKTGKLTVNH